MVEGVLLSVGLFFRFLFQSFKWFSRPELKSEKSIFFKGAVNVVRHFELEPQFALNLCLALPSRSHVVGRVAQSRAERGAEAAAR